MGNTAEAARFHHCTLLEFQEDLFCLDRYAEQESDLNWIHYPGTHVSTNNHIYMSNNTILPKTTNCQATAIPIAVGIPGTVLLMQ